MDPALKARITRLPASPGVYLMKDRGGAVFYVGKAANLRTRVRSYFARRGDGRAFVALLDDLLADLEFLITTNEKEALVLENELIKRHQPRFNVRLRDDKSFICLRLDQKHEWPRLEVVRAHGRKDDGALYFGPYASAGAIRETLRAVNRHFQLRVCSDSVLYHRERPCILFQIKRCPAPCVYDVSRAEYAGSVRDTILFLQGKGSEVVQVLRDRMLAASRGQRYEEAARTRDQLFAVERSLERQRTVLARAVDQDVFGVHREADRIALYVLHVRGGRLVGGQPYLFTGQEFPDAELLSSFVDLYYDQGNVVPDAVLLPLPLDDLDAKADWLTERRGRPVRVRAPKSGEGAGLVAMAAENARTHLADAGKSVADRLQVLERLQHRLQLSRLPRRMECFDISNLGASAVVASGVAFEDGEAKKDRYRHYHVRGVSSPDDFASMYQVVLRRARRGLAAGDLPDLFVIDGGKGQLGAALAALKDAGVAEVDAVGLAKSRILAGGRADRVDRSPERVFVPGRKAPIVLFAHSPELFLLTRIRDEAHRFAIAFHRRQRTRRAFASDLDAIPGVGARRRRALLRHFGSLDRVRAAPADEIAAVPGVGPALSRAIFDALHAASRVRGA